MADVNSQVQTYLTVTVYPGTASLDLTTNIIRNLASRTGDMTARFKKLITDAGASN